MKKIIGLGNCLVDVLAKINDDRLLAELGLPSGSMQLIDSIEKEKIDLRLQYESKTNVPGGSAANTIKALAKAGAEVGFIGKVADDEKGRFFAEAMQSVGVKTMLAKGTDGATGVANTFIQPNGQRTFATYLGISGSLSADDVKPEMLEEYDILYVEGYLVQNHMLIDSVMQMAKKQGMTICLDLASYNIVENDTEFFRYLLESFVDIVFANEEESKAFTGSEPMTALGQLAAMCDIAVVKLGANGSSAQRGNEVARVDAPEVAQVVDTTGAGDYFAAGFLYAYINGESLEKCLQKGGELSAEVIQVIGCPI